MSHLLGWERKSFCFHILPLFLFPRAGGALFSSFGDADTCGSIGVLKRGTGAADACTYVQGRTRETILHVRHTTRLGLDFTRVFFLDGVVYLPSAGLGMLDSARRRKCLRNRSGDCSPTRKNQEPLLLLRIIAWAMGTGWVRPHGLCCSFAVAGCPRGPLFGSDLKEQKIEHADTGLIGLVWVPRNWSWGAFSVSNLGTAGQAIQQRSSRSEESKCEVR